MATAELDAVWPPAPITPFLPLVDPGDAVLPAFGRLANRGCNCGQLQSVERSLEPPVVAQRRATPDEAQNFVRGSYHQPRSDKACVARLDELACGPHQDIGIPEKYRQRSDRCQPASSFPRLTRLLIFPLAPSSSREAGPRAPMPSVRLCRVCADLSGNPRISA